MDKRTSKNNKASSKAEDRPDWIADDAKERLANITSEFANLMSEEQAQLSPQLSRIKRLILRGELRRVQRNLETAREHLHAIILRPIVEQMRRGLREELETIRVQGSRIISDGDEIIQIEMMKEGQQNLEKQLVKEMVERAGTSHPADETILPPLIFALVFEK